MNTSRVAQSLPKVPDQDLVGRRKPAEAPRSNERAPEEVPFDELEAYDMPCTD